MRETNDRGREESGGDRLGITKRNRDMTREKIREGSNDVSRKVSRKEAAGPRRIYGGEPGWIVGRATEDDPENAECSNEGSRENTWKGTREYRREGVWR